MKCMHDLKHVYVILDIDFKQQKWTSPENVKIKQSKDAPTGKNRKIAMKLNGK